MAEKADKAMTPAKRHAELSNKVAAAVAKFSDCTAEEYAEVLRLFTKEIEWVTRASDATALSEDDIKSLEVNDLLK